MKLQGAYVQVPDALMQSDLTPAEKLVYISLLHFAGEEGTCWPSVHAIAVFCHVDDRTVQRSILTLVSIPHRNLLNHPTPPTDEDRRDVSIPHRNLLNVQLCLRYLAVSIVSIPHRNLLNPRPCSARCRNCSGFNPS